MSLKVILKSKLETKKVRRRVNIRNLHKQLKKVEME